MWGIFSKLRKANEKKDSQDIPEINQTLNEIIETETEILITDPNDSIFYELSNKEEEIIEYHNKISEIYLERLFLLPQIVNETDCSLDNAFLFFLFDEVGVEKLQEETFKSALMEFIMEKGIFDYKNIQEIIKFVEENFLYINEVEFDNGLLDGSRNFVNRNLAVYSNLTLIKEPISYDVKFLYASKNHTHELVIENLLSDFVNESLFIVKFNGYVFKLNEKQKNELKNFLHTENVKSRQVKSEKYAVIKRHIEELDDETEKLIYNFINELPKSIFLTPTMYRVGECVLLQDVYLSDIIGKNTAQHNNAIYSILHDNIELYNLLKHIKSEEFYKLERILLNRVNIQEELIKAFVWEAIQRQAPRYFADKWISDFGYYFIQEKLRNKSIDDYIGIYCNIQEIKTLEEENISYLTYFLMNNKVLSFNESTHYLDYFDVIEEKVKSINDEISLLKFEEKLLKQQSNELIAFNDLDLLTGYEFESYITELFKKMGYFSTTTKSSGDQGIDVIAERNGIKFGIQTKCYSSKVSNSAIQETVAGIAFHNCDRGIVITNNFFTQSAIDLASKNDIILWDRDILREKFEEFT